MDIDRSEDGGTAYLPDDCVVEKAKELRDALLGVLADKAVKRLDLSRIRRLDLSGLQVIYAALASGNAKGRSLAAVGVPTKGADRLLALSGYGRILGERGWWGG